MPNFNLGQRSELASQLKGLTFVNILSGAGKWGPLAYRNVEWAAAEDGGGGDGTEDRTRGGEKSV